MEKCGNSPKSYSTLVYLQRIYKWPHFDWCPSGVPLYIASPVKRKLIQKVNCAHTKSKLQIIFNPIVWHVSQLRIRNQSILAETRAYCLSEFRNFVPAYLIFISGTLENSYQKYDSWMGRNLIFPFVIEVSKQLLLFVRLWAIFEQCWKLFLSEVGACFL